MCCVCLCHKVGNAAFLLTRTGSKPLCPLLSDSKSRLQAETDPEAADTSQVLNSLAPDRRQVDLRRFPKKLCRHVCSIYPFSCSELDRPRRSALDPETPRPRDPGTTSSAVPRSVNGTSNASSSASKLEDLSRPAQGNLGRPVENQAN